MRGNVESGKGERRRGEKGGRGGLAEDGLGGGGGPRCVVELRAR